LFTNRAEEVRQEVSRAVRVYSEECADQHSNVVMKLKALVSQQA